MLSTRNLSGRIFLTVVASYIILSAYFILSTYFSSIRTAEEDTLLKLKGIARTLSLKLDGNMHKQLMDRYKAADEIKTSEQDGVYSEIHQCLKKVQLKNEINTPIYTMVYDPATRLFYFGATSADKPYFRHPYSTFPKQLLEQYETGGVVNAYGDENGIWLSAFVPIKDSTDKAVALLQVDERFDDFILRARKRLYNNILISVGLLLLVILVLYVLLKGILENDEIAKKKLEASKRLIEKKNKDIMDSINYASRIQSTIMVEEMHIQQYLPDSFVLYKPKDVVSGDFYWFFPLANGQYFNVVDNKSNLILIGVIDCTGHGVPGAIMSMLAVSLLNEIVNDKKILEPGEILTMLNRKIISTLKQNDSGADNRDGMDVALCLVDLQKMELQYAGAYRPLYRFANGTLEVIKGNRFPVGGTQHDAMRKFTNHTIPIQKGDSIYCFSDGYVDQFGGNGKREEKITSRRLKKILTEYQHFPMREQKHLLDETFTNWRGSGKQIDDVAFIGVRF